MVDRDLYLQRIRLLKIKLTMNPEKKATSQSYKRIGYEVKRVIIKACWLDDQEGVVR